MYTQSVQLWLPAELLHTDTKVAPVLCCRDDHHCYHPLAHSLLFQLVRLPHDAGQGQVRPLFCKGAEQRSLPVPQWSVHATATLAGTLMLCMLCRAMHCAVNVADAMVQPATMCCSRCTLCLQSDPHRVLEAFPMWCTKCTCCTGSAASQAW